MTKPINIKELAEYLEGTCKSLTEALADLDMDDSGELTQEQAAELDSLVFECEACNWWSEESQRGNCEDECICLSCEESV